MPTVNLRTSIGSIPFKYTISTPTNDSADQIDYTLPTILFLHADFFPSETMYQQFGDPQLRAFNLVIADSRGWGGMVGDTYDQHEAADDVYQLIVALNLPPVFIAALSMGTIAGFQLAITHPDRVRGLFLASHLCLPELPGITESRQEIYDLWMEGLARNDMSYVEDSVTASHQLAYNNKYTNLTVALLKVAIERGATRPGIERFAEADKHLLVDFYANRTRYTKAQLEAFAECDIPVWVVAGDEDVAYPVSYAEEFVQELNCAGVQMLDLYIIQTAPHFLSITHPVEFNTLLYEFIIQHLDSDPPPAPEESTIQSPFLATLIRVGLKPGQEHDPVESQT